MSTQKPVNGGVCAPKEFLAGAVHCGIKAGNTSRDDLALVASAGPCIAAGAFTKNKVKAAPVRVSRLHLRQPSHRAVVLNSGNANACTGEAGRRDSVATAAAVAERLDSNQSEVFVCSTGRIGIPLPISRIVAAVPSLVASLSRRGSEAAAIAIMTSDTVPKEVACEFVSNGAKFRIGGIAKGAGMINPNMATMLCVITTDANLEKRHLQRCLRAAVDQSFNRITIDGDMSTNDTVIALANGASGATPVPEDFQSALDWVTLDLAKKIVLDGEGVSRFVEVEVCGAASSADAKKAAEAIANSTLVKCAWAGGDPNWGRILDAAGYSGAKMREQNVDISYDRVPAVAGGLAASTPPAELHEIAARKAFKVVVNLNLGGFRCSVLTTDLTEEYVRLNLGE